MTNRTATQINTPGRRAAAFWFSDGLVEIVFGLFVVLWAGWGIASSFKLLHPWMLLIGWLIVYGLFFPLMYRYPKVIDYLKTRITYPRAGYAQPPAELSPDQDFLHDMFTGTKSLQLITLKNASFISENVTDFRVRALTLIFTAHTLGLIGYSYPVKWLIPILMTAFAALAFLLNRKDAHSYSWYSVIPIILVGFLPIAMEFPRQFIMVFPVLVYGTWLLLQGSLALTRFLRDNPCIKTHGEGPA
jgi:hypothetical protein